jgi:hypothetical protein
VRLPISEIENNELSTFMEKMPRLHLKRFGEKQNSAVKTGLKRRMLNDPFQGALQQPSARLFAMPRRRA